MRDECLDGHRCGPSCGRGDSAMSFPRLEIIIWPVPRNSSRLGAFGCAESFRDESPTEKKLRNVPRPGKIIWPLVWQDLWLLGGMGRRHA